MRNVQIINPQNPESLNGKAELIARVYELLAPVRYVGENACGQFLFAQNSPTPTHIFDTLECAMNEIGSVVIIEGDSIRSPRFHAGYNAGLFGKKYEPCTRIPDGAPRELSEGERKEYAYGYMHGILLRPRSK